MFKLRAKVAAIWADEHHWTVHCVRSSEWNTFHLHFNIAYIYQCIWGWKHLQKLSPKCKFIYIFLFRSGAPPMTLLTGGALTDPSCPQRVHHWCMAGGGGKNPGYAGDYHLILDDNHVKSWNILSDTSAQCVKLIKGIWLHLSNTRITVSGLC